jgi:DNA-binding CsgD family transcriptional regulator
MKPLVVATATDKTPPRTYSGSRQKVVAHDIGSAPDGARIAALTHAARWLELRIAAPLAVVARVNMGDAHDVRGGSNGAQREPLTKGEPAAEATSATVLASIEAEHSCAAGDSDPASWDAAARGWEARPAPFRAAYARWRQAEAALARRDRAQAEQALRAAYATATGLGARALQAELGALAGRARIELPTAAPEPAAGEPPPAGTDLGLTARELEVLQHLARGATNRQIADALYISVRTVGVHVSHILGKLSAANRGEAAAIAHRLGLAP